MPAIIESINRVSTLWTGLMTAVLWQSTVVILIVTVAALVLRRASPRLRYWLWQIVTIKLLLMPFWVLAIPWPFAHWPLAPRQLLRPRNRRWPIRRSRRRPSMFPRSRSPQVSPLPPGERQGVRALRRPA